MNPKYNPDTLLPETISAVLAALIYDEENFATSVYRLFGFRVHAWTDRTQKYYYAVVIDEERNRLFIVFRGTDGRNRWGRLLSWVTINLRARPNRQGFHTGFWKIAVEASQNIAPYIKKYAHVYLVGHSQGSGTCTCQVALICRVIKKRMLPNLKHLQADLWCSPPAVNDTGKSEIDTYIHDGLVSINNWIMPGDLISKKKGILRGVLGGKDVGEIRFMPDLIHKKYGLLDALSHSPRQCLAAYAVWLCGKCNEPPKEDLKLIEYVLRENMVIN